MSQTVMSGPAFANTGSTTLTIRESEFVQPLSSVNKYVIVLWPTPISDGSISPVLEFVTPVPCQVPPEGSLSIRMVEIS